MAYPLRLASAILLLATLATGAKFQATRGHTGENPVAKVITLLEDLVTTIEGEGQTEATSYDEFACFCKSKTEDKSESVKTSQDTIDSLSAAIEANTALVAEKEAELTERKKKEEELTGEVSDLKSRCAAENAEFEAVIADYTKALDQLEKAITSMEASKPASMVELRKTVGEALALVPALGNAMGAAQRKTMQAFVQENVDPEDPEYKFQSAGIIETLQGLKTTFTEKKDEEETAWAAAKQACQDLETSLTDELATNSEAMVTLRSDADSLKEQVATDRTSLIQEEATLKDDKEYLKDLTERCETRARDWDQRSQLRGGELQALAGALSILKEGKDGGASVEAMDAEVNKRASLWQRGNRSGSVLLSKASLSALHMHEAATARLIGDTPDGRKLLKDLAPARKGALATHHRKLRRQPVHPLQTGARQPIPAATQHVVAMLRHNGERLKSTMLSALAAKLAQDPFAKVKQLIQQLIERLLHEATQEATKKGFCDTEVGKATNKREYRFNDVQGISAELGVLEAKKVTLEEDIVQLEDEVGVLRDDLNTTTQLRAEEKEQNLASIKTAKEGLSAVREAITILQVFYKSAARASSLLQAKASPVDDDTAGPGFTGTYGGQQNSATGIVAILEVIASDFERTARLTTESEKTAAEDFVEYNQNALQDIAGKERQTENSKEDLESTENMLVIKMSDLTTAQNLLDAALQTLEDLKPMCIDTGMSYASRVEKREAEIAALKEALTYLAPAL